MLYLTGDVHTKLSGSWEQKKSGPEIDNAIKYLEILEEYGISSTLFLNGKCLDEEPEKTKKLLEYNVELGGHTYDNFGSMNPIKSYFFRKIWGCIYGPEWYQRKDIKKTKKAFQAIGIEMKSWRTHSFGGNNNTFDILMKEGVRYASDLLGNIKPFEKNGIIHLPINIPVDNNTFFYGPLCPENRDPFASCTKGRIHPQEWFEIIKKRIKENEKNGRDSILLIHPETMAALDNFKLFREIAKFLSGYKSRKVSDFEENNNLH